MKRQMLKSLGYSDLPSFISDVVPSNIAINGVIETALDSGKSEVEVIAELRSIASENQGFSVHLSELDITERLFHQ
jgi:glycine dehydrogenase